MILGTVHPDEVAIVVSDNAIYVGIQLSSIRLRDSHFPIFRSENNVMK